MTTTRTREAEPRAEPLHFVALIVGNISLALGPYFVRVADTGPVSAAFWRVLLPLPLLFALAWRGERTGSFGLRAWAAVALAGVLFGFDLAAWHIGIEHTRMGNASLFGNSGSLILMAWGLIAARRMPRQAEISAIALALTGSAILLGRSLEIDRSTLVGDLFCILAGFFYFFYIMLLQGARGQFGSWSLLFHASLASAPVLLAIGLLLGEPVWPQVWWPLIGLALGSQVIGQGLLVFALRHFSPLVIGLVLLTQPAISVLCGWVAFDERLAGLDVLGMVLVGASLVLARLDTGRPA